MTLLQLATRDFREIIVLILAFFGVLGTFASVVAMFVSLRKTVENQSLEIHDMKDEMKKMRNRLDDVIRLEERVKNLEQKRAR